MSLLTARLFQSELQALVYNILPSTVAVFSYAIGSRKLSDNEAIFCRCSDISKLVKTTQFISDVCFITDASSNKTKIVSIETELSFFFFFLPGVDAPRVYGACLGGRLHWFTRPKEGCRKPVLGV